MAYLTTQIAQSIVDRTMEILDNNVNIMNVRGEIIGTGDLARLGEIHEGALLALAQQRTVEIDESMCRQLHGVRPGVNLPLRAEGEVIGVIGLTGDPRHLRRYGELVRVTAEMMVEQADLLGLIAQESRIREELVLGLVRAEEPSANLISWAQRMKVDLTMPRVAAIIEVDTGNLEVEAARDELHNIQSLLAFPERDNLVATLSLNSLVVLKPALNQRGVWDLQEHRERVGKLLSRMNEHSRLFVRIALGKYFPGEGGIARSFRTAQATLKIGSYKFLNQSCYFYDDLILPVMLEGLRSGWQVQELTLPLTKLRKHDNSGVLYRTLVAWFAHQTHAGETSSALSVHRNTLEYRLNRISDITGLDLSQLDSRLLLYIGLQLETFA
jgi:carbohydrate diacid regulator